MEILTNFGLLKDVRTFLALLKTFLTYYALHFFIALKYYLFQMSHKPE